jgi:hypothetical protein
MWHSHPVSGSRCTLTTCSFGLSATSQQYFSLRTNQPPAISQQYFSLRTNQHQPSTTSQTNRLKPAPSNASPHSTKCRLNYLDGIGLASHLDWRLMQISQCRARCDGNGQMGADTTGLSRAANPRLRTPVPHSRGNFRQRLAGGTRHCEGATASDDVCNRLRRRPSESPHPHRPLRINKSIGSEGSPRGPVAALPEPPDGTKATREKTRSCGGAISESHNRV